ncbi:hypothetical protein SNE40_008593 [Patella caerulea]|uniref:G-protein coupled receptors family 1 profile domain-containing protein n=1 Tax=Patella caerulea TaxID=87958 RepID=A0AAN8K1B4_PATCE
MAEITTLSSPNTTDDGLMTTMDTMFNLSTTLAPPEGSSCDLGYIPGVLSQATAERLVHFSTEYAVIHGYISAVVCTFGIMANVANIIVLTRKNMISSTNTILMWLAVADLFTMLSYLPFIMRFYIFREKDLQMFRTRDFAWICFLMFHASFGIVCHTVAIWLTIALAIFRYIYICMPTKGAIYCNIRRARITIFSVYLLTIIICIPNYIVNKISSGDLVADQIKTNGDDYSGLINVTRPTVLSDIYYHPDIRVGTPAAQFISKSNGYIQSILVKLIPCAMLTTLTILLIHAMHKAYRKRMRLKSQGRKAESEKHGEHNRTTGMLLAVVVLFMLTELPQGILTLMTLFEPCLQNYVYNPLGDLVDIMALINNSINFVLYCTMSKQFRDTFMDVFCTCCAQNKHGFLKMKLVKSSHNGNKTKASTCNTHV